MVALSPLMQAEEALKLPGCQGIFDKQFRIGDQIIAWKNTVRESDATRLLSWCQAVGPPVYIEQKHQAQNSNNLDTLVIVSWNVKVGGGDLDIFIKKLLNGEFTTDKSSAHFVLLLQEAFRSGSTVPHVVSAAANSGRSIRPIPPGGVRTDVVAIAKRHGLHLLYIPSMRNGSLSADIPAEDRGNAILSTLPLLAPMAVELPLERQRRVAIIAGVSVRPASQLSKILQLINVHLENRTDLSRFYRSFGSARLNQLNALLNAVPPSALSVLAGDFNTWFYGADEPVIKHVEKYYRRFDKELGGPGSVGRPPRWKLDYIFFRLPKNAKLEYRRIANSFGSDHYPLLAKIVVQAAPGNRGILE